MLYTETALGRLVAPGTPEEVEERIVLRDLVLKVLFDSWRSPFNPHHRPLEKEALQRITLIERKMLDDVVDELTHEGLVQTAVAAPPMVKGLALTQKGFEEIQRVPHWSASVAP